MADTTFTDGSLAQSNRIVSAWLNDANYVTYKGALTQILVGGGSGTRAVWTTATGSGSPVRATGPTITSLVVSSGGISITAGGLTLGSDVNAAVASTFSWDGSGGTSSSVSLTAQLVGQWVTLNIPAMSATTGTSSTVLTSNTALAAAFRPAVQSEFACVNIINNGAVITALGVIQITTGGLVKLLRDSTATAFTNTATAGMNRQTSITYFVG